MDDLVVRIGKERLPPRERGDDEPKPSKATGDWPPFLLNDALARVSRKHR